jgi:hypothetical protein
MIPMQEGLTELTMLSSFAGRDRSSISAASGGSPPSDSSARRAPARALAQIVFCHRVDRP